MGGAATPIPELAQRARRKNLKVLCLDKLDLVWYTRCYPPMDGGKTRETEMRIVVQGFHTNSYSVKPDVWRVKTFEGTGPIHTQEFKTEDEANLAASELTYQKIHRTMCQYVRGLGDWATCKCD